MALPFELESKTLVSNQDTVNILNQLDSTGQLELWFREFTVIILYYIILDFIVKM